MIEDDRVPIPLKVPVFIVLIESVSTGTLAHSVTFITGCQGFVGFEYDGQCYGLYDVESVDPTGSVPSDICEKPADADCDHAGSGTGPIVDVKDRTGTVCYKYIG